MTLLNIDLQVRKFQCRIFSTEILLKSTRSYHNTPIIAKFNTREEAN